FALCRNAPAVQSFDPALGVERDPNDAIVTSPGTKNLVNPSDVGLDFVGGLDIDGFFSVEQHRICFFVVSGERSGGHSVHPLRSVASPGRERNSQYTDGREQYCFERLPISFWRCCRPVAR